MSSQTGKPAPTTVSQTYEKDRIKKDSSIAFQQPWRFLARLVDIQKGRGYKSTVRALGGDEIWGGPKNYVPFLEHPETIALTWSPRTGDFVLIELRGHDITSAHIKRHYDKNEFVNDIKDLETDPHTVFTTTTT